MRKLAAGMVLGVVGQFVFAAEPSWQVFDSAYPEDFIDTLSITFLSKNIVRFWERAGAGRRDQNGKVAFPSYTLTEIDCVTRTIREIRWDYALEAQDTAEGMAARVEFLKSTQQWQVNYPSKWESIEPNKHAYARLDFVCKERSQHNGA